MVRGAREAVAGPSRPHRARVVGLRVDRSPLSGGDRGRPGHGAGRPHPGPPPADEGHRHLGAHGARVRVRRRGLDGARLRCRLAGLLRVPAVRRLRSRLGLRERVAGMGLRGGAAHGHRTPAERRRRGLGAGLEPVLRRRARLCPAAAGAGRSRVRRRRLRRSLRPCDRAGHGHHRGAGSLPPRARPRLDVRSAVGGGGSDGGRVGLARALLRAVRAHDGTRSRLRAGGHVRVGLDGGGPRNPAPGTGRGWARCSACSRSRAGRRLSMPPCSCPSPWRDSDATASVRSGSRWPRSVHSRYSCRSSSPGR